MIVCENKQSYGNHSRLRLPDFDEALARVLALKSNAPKIVKMSCRATVNDDNRDYLLLEQAQKIY